jgi:hypothetical protein
LANTLRLEKFFSAYDLEGNMIKSKINPTTHGVPSTSTPEVPEVTQANIEKGEPSSKPTDPKA